MRKIFREDGERRGAILVHMEPPVGEDCARSHKMLLTLICIIADVYREQLLIPKVRQLAPPIGAHLVAPGIPIHIP